MVIADDTDAAAQAKWQRYREGADMEALSWMSDQGNKDQTAAEESTARYINLPEGAINFNMGTLVGSDATIARMLDEIADVAGAKGVMLTFDDFLVGMERFGRCIQPLMRSRTEQARAAA